MIPAVQEHAMDPLAVDIATVSTRRALDEDACEHRRIAAERKLLPPKSHRAEEGVVHSYKHSLLALLDSP